MRAALSVCHIVGLSDPQSDSLLTEMIDQRSATVIQDASDLIADKVTRYGREQRQLWIVLAANAFLKTKRDPNNKINYMQESVDRITRPYYKIMACQEDAPTSVEMPPKAGREDLPNGILEYLPQTMQPGTDPALLDLENIAEWTFDDWSFIPGMETGQFRNEVY
jgi:hypothetical protein